MRNDVIQYFADDFHQIIEVLELQNNTYALSEQYSIEYIAILIWIDTLGCEHKSNEYLQMREYEAMYQWYQDSLKKPSKIRLKQVSALIRKESLRL